ncbi:MAG: hypothetical protein ACXAE3_03605 [Candidatus Kariarchaeaceae archaeon]
MYRRWLLLLGYVTTVSADTGHVETTDFTWTEFFLTLGVISLFLALGLYGLSKWQSHPGSLPIKKLGIATALTVLVNAILFAIVYMV